MSLTLTQLSEYSDPYLYLWQLKPLQVNARVCVLTVGAAVDFYAEPDPSFLAPVQRDEPEEARHDSLLQLVADRALGVGVAREGL